jgi:hypothetical protein
MNSRPPGASHNHVAPRISELKKLGQLIPTKGVSNAIRATLYF